MKKIYFILLFIGTLQTAFAEDKTMIYETSFNCNKENLTIDIKSLINDSKKVGN